MGCDESKMFIFPVKGEGVDEAYNHLLSEGFTFKEEVDDKVDDERVILPKSQDSDWSFIQVDEKSEGMKYYICDPELKPQYFISYLDGVFEPIVKTDSFLPKYPVTMPLPDFYFKKDGHYELNDKHPIVHLIEKIVELRESVLKGPRTQFYHLYQLMRKAEVPPPSELLKELMESEKQHIEREWTLLGYTAKALKFGDYRELDIYTQMLSSSVHDVRMTDTFEGAKRSYNEMAELPEGERASSSSAHDEFVNYLQTGIQYMFPRLSAIGLPLASIPFEEAYMYIDPYDFSRMEEKHQLLKELEIKLKEVRAAKKAAEEAEKEDDEDDEDSDEDSDEDEEEETEEDTIDSMKAELYEYRKKMLDLRKEFNQILESESDSALSSLILREEMGECSAKIQDVQKRIEKALADKKEKEEDAYDVMQVELDTYAQRMLSLQKELNQILETEWHKQTDRELEIREEMKECNAKLIEAKNRITKACEDSDKRLLEQAKSFCAKIEAQQ